MEPTNDASAPRSGVGETNRVVLTKHHGLGNDFLIAVEPPRPLGPEDARRWCHRRHGIGADGLIQATAEPGAQTGDGRSSRRWRMALWNSDGSRAEVSGNGLRCLGQAIAGHLDLDPTADHELIVETDAGTRSLLVKAGGGHSAAIQVRAGMGKAVDGPPPSSRWAEVGVTVTGQRGVDVGNPHLVAFTEGGTRVDMAAVGPVIEADYPGGINVHLVTVEDRGRLTLEVWERGAGVTEACGSGACAAAWAAHQAGLTDGTVVVDMPGGSATVELVDGEIFLTGPAVEVGEVILDG